MKRKHPRLKKNPELPDYVVEITDDTQATRVQGFKEFWTRGEAREFVKTSVPPNVRARIFHVKFIPVSDRKAK